MDVDHVAFGWDALASVRTALDRVGLPYDEGGAHADGTTHMALTGFADGSYLEYIAPTEGTDPSEAGFWPDALAARSGPCAWAVRVDDVARAAKRAIDAGSRVDGPIHGGRDRPDGRRVEWDQAFERVVGHGPWLLPFPIADRTPRTWRVAETADIRTLTGVDTVVLGVRDLDDAATLFDRRYRTATPVPIDTAAVDGDARVLPGSPVALVSAGDPRLERVGERPMAVLLGTDDLTGARVVYELTPTVAWGDRSLAWFDHDVLRGRVGVVE